LLGVGLWAIKTRIVLIAIEPIMIEKFWSLQARQLKNFNRPTCGDQNVFVTNRGTIKKFPSTIMWQLNFFQS
jgi:hypothetical protein